MFEKLQRILSVVEKNNKDQDYIEYQKIQKRWFKKTDKALQKNAKIIDFTEGVLTLKVKKTTWKNEIIFMNKELKKNSQTNKTQLKK